MSRLYVPPGLKARHYLNLGTINGMDIGSGAPVYERGTSTKDYTVKNDLFMARAIDVNEIVANPLNYAVEYSGFGSKFSFQLTEQSVMFFEVLTILNPPNTTFSWTTSREYLDVYLYRVGVGFVTTSRIWYPAASNATCGPFVSEFATTIPVGQSDIYILAGWANFTSTQTSHRHIGSRVNLIGYKA